MSSWYGIKDCDGDLEDVSPDKTSALALQEQFSQDFPAKAPFTVVPVRVEEVS